MQNSRPVWDCQRLTPSLGGLPLVALEPNPNMATGELVLVSTSNFVEIWLVWRGAIIQIFAVMRVNGDDPLNRHQTTATHMPVTTPCCFAIGESSLLPRKKPPDKRSTEHRVGWVMDKFVERVELFVGRKRSLYAFHYKLFGTTSVCRDTTAVHRAGFLCTSVFKPYIRPRRTTRVKQSEIFKSVRHESRYLDELVIVVRRVTLQFANRDLYGFLAA